MCVYTICVYAPAMSKDRKNRLDLTYTNQQLIKNSQGVNGEAININRI